MQNISRAAQLLKEASDLLNNEGSADAVTDQPQNVPNPVRRPPVIDLVSNSVNRAANMINRASFGGVFRRMNNQERLRSSGPTNVNRTTATKRNTGSANMSKKNSKAIEFALLRNNVDADDDDENSETIKWDSILADGILMVQEDNTEKEMRFKIKDALSKKYPLSR